MAVQSNEKHQFAFRIHQYVRSRLFVNCRDWIMAFEMEELAAGQILRVSVSGNLTTEDYQPFVAEAEGLIAHWGELRLLIELHEIKGFSLGAMWEDLKFDLQHFGDITKLAVVGEKQWHIWMTELCKPFISGETHFFSRSHAAEAVAWLRSPKGVAPPTSP